MTASTGGGIGDDAGAARTTAAAPSSETVALWPHFVWSGALLALLAAGLMSGQGPSTPLTLGLALGGSLLNAGLIGGAVNGWTRSVTPMSSAGHSGPTPMPTSEERPLSLAEHRAARRGLDRQLASGAIDAAEHRRRVEELDARR